MRAGARTERFRHEGFLRHRNGRWLWIALALCVAAAGVYAIADFRPQPRGDTWYGYATGVLGAAIIVWLALLGLRKRVITDGRWSLKAWVSAHVYLGLALVVIATLHTGLHLGWNVHTLVYVLMMLVIGSGVVGVVAYARLPRLLSANRGETTQSQWLVMLKSIDERLLDAAQPLDRAGAQTVRLAVEQTVIAGGLWQRLSGQVEGCATARALAQIEQLRGGGDEKRAAALTQVAALLARKQEVLAKVRQHIRLRTTLELWLYVHVPATFALLAALTAHIVSVFFYW